MILKLLLLVLILQPCSLPSLSRHLDVEAMNIARDVSDANDLTLMTQRRRSAITGSLGPQKTSSISKWLTTLGANGRWPDSEINYLSGCPAQTAGWPAQDHWRRVIVLASAWHGGLTGTEALVNNATVREAVTRTMDFWFSNDFTNPSCVDQGGTAACPCDTPGFWNTNWFSNTILIPQLTTQTCLILGEMLTPTQLSNCTNIALRAYSTFVRKPTFLTGANLLDVAKVGIDQGLLNGNTTLLGDAYLRIHNEVIVHDTLKADGIRPDGTFGQHDGIIYNGNYGKDYAGDVLDLEVAAADTQFAANDTSKAVFTSLFDADSWMVARNVITGVNHWDLSVVGRAISLPVLDKHYTPRATAQLNINLTQVQELGNLWNSDVLTRFAQSLSGVASSANVAKLTGNRMFYANDYMVHRGSNYITTLRMYSKRTLNTECTVSQNLLGFHLSDGTLYTYLQGNEYEDIAGAWDWNLIPGTTTDFGATPLDCSHTKFTGIESFVGGVSTGTTGIAVMRYTNPLTKALRWQKAWFFLADGSQHVMVSGLSSTSTASVVTVLDQRLHVGDVVVDGVALAASGTFSFPDAQSMWHGGVGYVFPLSNGTFPLNVDVGIKQGDWSKIGTSKRPPFTVDLMTATISHRDHAVPYAYTAFPGMDRDPFVARATTPLPFSTLQNDEHISAVFDSLRNTVMMVFWDAAGGSFTFSHDDFGRVTILSTGSAALILDLTSFKVTLADPSQELASLMITVVMDGSIRGSRAGNVVLPSGGVAGSSVHVVLE
ncbi:hypothetical protein ONZ45_g9168 [Pleurotus djamor]|nr:hypothetical protein ONZ45_g9168 [Pleurotus djamor]